MYTFNHTVLTLLKEFITLGVNNILHHNFSVFSCCIESWTLSSISIIMNTLYTFPTISQYYLKLWLRSCRNVWSHLVARVKHIVTKLNVQYSTLRVISCHQKSLLPSQIYTAHKYFTNKCLSYYLARVRNHWKEIKAQTTI